MIKNKIKLAQNRKEPGTRSREKDIRKKIVKTNQEKKTKRKQKRD